MTRPAYAYNKQSFVRNSMKVVQSTKTQTKIEINYIPMPIRVFYYYSLFRFIFAKHKKPLLTRIYVCANKYAYTYA